jgi:hypothetical protein
LITATASIAGAFIRSGAGHYAHTSLLAFDAPSREECTVERVNSNTPMQALALLNDPTFVEAARTLAEQVVRQRRRRA